MDVLRARVVLWVEREIDGGFVIEIQRRRVLGVLAEFVEQRAQVGGLFGGFRRADDFGLTGRECHRRLLFAAPRDGGSSVHEHVA
eukprot:1077890-Pleurochrysis_carterae.AAC.2